MDRKRSSWVKGTPSLMSLFLSVTLCAQTNAGSRAPSKTEPQNGVIENAGSKPHDNSFVIGNDDILNINVWKEAEISRSIPVRSDGKISLPLVGEVQATGRTPLILEQEIAEKLKNYISEPEVTVIVQQINSQKFNIMGQVARPGSYALASATTVLDAIAVAGGFRDFAKRKSIYVLRQNGQGAQIRIPFNYKEVIKGENPSQNIRLQPRDTIVVP
ncbi:MAG TPA: polysaccharide biosynthesis/export family protein [Candidatus Sulfotelmatobacter sp.]|nr:polysaccharide biosynthesis/export family protein [Candidatus Sulfotelmatobacter sp.]